MLALSTDSQSPQQSPSLSPVNSTNSKRMSRLRKTSTRMRVRSIDNLDAIEDIQVIEIAEGNYNALSTIVERSENNTVQSANNSPKSNKSISKSSSFILKSITDGKIEREREIFLRAALQLLQQDSRNDHIDHSNHSIDSKQSNNINKNHHKHITTDVIRYGCLKKVSRTNAFSSIKSQFKTKYVELRYGKFTYEDYHHNHLPWNYHHNQSKDELNNHNHKTIILSVDKCQCRPFQIRSANGNCVFELTEYGGPRRLWMASSENERDLWVNNIRNAMIGCVDDTLGLFDDYQRHSPVTIDKPIDNCSIATNLSNQDDNNITSINSKKSCEGPAAAFAMDIAKFVTLQDAVADASSIQSFIHLVTRLYYRSVDIAVPVFYVKCHASSSNFAFSAQDILNRNTLLSVETSQIWKDLQRDNLVINGEHIRGESGTEAMIGAMMRHIMDKVDVIRCTDNNCIQNNQSPNRPKVYDRFDITEAQALACARDLLILCNRTQSGGDTYFCVDALLCNKQNNLCIVTPLSYEADPIEIYVDIVEEKSSKSMPSGITSNERLRARSMTEYVKSDLIDIVDINRKFNESNINIDNNHHSLEYKPSLTITNHNTIWDDQSTISELTADTLLHNVISHSAPISLKTTPIDSIKNYKENRAVDRKQSNDAIIYENAIDTSKNNKNKTIFRAIKSSFSPVNNALPQFMYFKPNSKKELNDQIISDIHDSSSDNSQNSQTTSLLNQSMNTNLCIRIEVQVSSRYRLCDSNPQDDNSTLGEVLGQFHQIFFIKSGCRGRPVVSDRVVSIVIDKPPSNPS